MSTNSPPIVEYGNGADGTAPQPYAQASVSHAGQQPSHGGYYMSAPPAVGHPQQQQQQQQRVLAAGDIVAMVQRGELDPNTQVVFAGGPAAQGMNADRVDSFDPEKVLYREAKNCLPWCSRKYTVTEVAIEEENPICCCCCTSTSHYNLSQVLDLHHTDCCGWCCSSLVVQLDQSVEDRDSLVLTCVDTQKFMKIMKPRIGRVHVGGGNAKGKGKLRGRGKGGRGGRK